MLVSA
jgi:hypothetical protein